MEKRAASSPALLLLHAGVTSGEQTLRPSECQEQRKNQYYVNSLAIYMWGKQVLLQKQSGIPAYTTFKSPMGTHCLRASAVIFLPRSHHLTNGCLTMVVHKNFTYYTGRGEKQQSFSWHRLIEPSVLLHGSVCKIMQTMPRGCSINRAESCFTLCKSEKPAEILSSLCSAPSQ